MQIDHTHTSANFNDRPNHSAINILVYHFTKVDLATTFQLFEKENNVSAHYVIAQNGIIYQCVADEQRAWHAGKSFWRGQTQLNDTSLGIELVNNGAEPFPVSQINALIELSHLLLKKYPTIPPYNIVGHSDIAPDRKDDPGRYFPWQYLAQQGIGIWPDQAAYATARQLMAVQGDKSPVVTLIQQKLLQLGYQLEQTAMFDPATTHVITAFRSRFTPSILEHVWDTQADAVLQDLIKQYDCHLAL